MTTRCAVIAVLGAANAGKSTFINTLVGEKVSIVTSKAHTTRNRVYGIVCRGNTQLILVDTPGLIEFPKGMLQNYMRKAVWKTAREADMALVLVDAHRPQKRLTVSLLRHLQQKSFPIFLVLNKVDAVEKPALLPQALEYTTMATIEGTFMISGLQNKGVEDLVEALLPHCPEGPWVFSEEDVTQVSQNFMAAEITREKVFKYLHAELPYSIHVETDMWYIPGVTDSVVKAPASGISIFQTIFVEKESQRRLAIGHQGHRLKVIGQEARAEMMGWLQQKVHLFLHVKVAPQWSTNPDTYKNLDQNA